MLTVERAPYTIFDRVIRAVVYSAFLAPFLLMGAGLTLLGALALGPRKDLADLWVCLPAGLALIMVIAAILWWGAWRVPALTVARFTFDGAELVVETPALGAVACPVAALRAVAEERGRRGRGLRGWWLQFEDVGWLFLTRDTPQAEALVGRLRASLRHNHTERGAAPDPAA